MTDDRDPRDRDPRDRDPQSRRPPQRRPPAAHRGFHDEFTESLSEELAGDVGSDPTSAATSGSTPAGGSASVLRSSVVMGAGTVLSRLGGVLRGVVLAAALGAGTVADMFNLGNTLPNVIYILIIGGALNAVFIPELVRHMKDDPDGGRAYADRLITLVGMILLIVSILAVALAPWVVRIYATPQYTPQQLELATAFARLCLPQIFFYGVYTMLSQVLNARGHFGTPMFAPIVNNIVAIATFVLFIAVAGPAAGSGGTLSGAQVSLLGIGTTLGVALQALILIPVLRRSRYTFRLNWRWRGAGLGNAGGLAFWTIGLVLVNQVAYAVIVRLATGVNAVSQEQGLTAAGLTAYTNAHLMFVLPHSVITVSIVAALLPRMSRAAHGRRFSELAADVGGGMRTAAALIVPAGVALVVLGTEAGVLLFNYGQTSTASAEVTGSLASIFALGLLPFTLYYVILRGWYALELTRTAFWVTVVLNALYLAIAVPLFEWTTSRQAGPVGLSALALGYVGSYWITLVIAWVKLSRRLGGLQSAHTIRSLVRMSVAAVATFAVMSAIHGLLSDHLSTGSKGGALIDIVIVGSAGLATYLGAANLMHISEVTEVVAMIKRRIPGGR